MNNPFPVRLRAASIVPRWSIVHTQKPDYIAGHSFYVAVYSRIVVALIAWPGDLGRLLDYALLHDFDELFVGDVVGPVKHNVVDARRHSDFVGRKILELTPSFANFTSGVTDDMRLIVKAADQLDALFFTLGEQALGNQIIAARIPSAYDKLREAWFKLPGCEGEGFMVFADDPKTPYRGPVKLVNLWLDVVVPAINEHCDPAMYDIERNGHWP